MLAVDLLALVEAIGRRRPRPLIFAAAGGAVPLRHVELLRKLTGIFGSSHEGERANAAKLADELVRKLNLTWPQIISLPTVTDIADDTDPAFWAAVIADCQRRPDLLRKGEAAFLVTVAKWTARGNAPNAKQQKWLKDIAGRTS